MKTNMGLWIDHRKAVIVAVSSKGEKTSVIESRAERQPGRFDGVRSTTPYESQKVPADGRQDIKFADQLNIYYDEVISVLRDAEPMPPCFLSFQRTKRLKSAFGWKFDTPFYCRFFFLRSSSSFCNFFGGTRP
jgi:hypothetical protein